MNCLEYLKSKGYNLEGYSPDFYATLYNAKPETPEECYGILAWAEATYG